MAPQASLVSTPNVCQVPNSIGGGCQVGAAASSLVGFFGATPIVQPAGFGAITDTSGGVASASTGLQALTSSYNSTIVANAISTLAKQTNAIEAALVALGALSV